MNYQKSPLAKTIFKCPLLFFLLPLSSLFPYGLYVFMTLFNLYLVVIFYAPVVKDYRTVDKSITYHLHRAVLESKADFNFILEKTKNTDLHTFMQVRYTRTLSVVREEHRELVKLMYGKGVFEALIFTVVMSGLAMTFGNTLADVFTDGTMQFPPHFYGLITLISCQVSVLLTTCSSRLLRQLNEKEQEALLRLLYEYSKLSDAHQDEINLLRQAATESKRLHWLSAR